MFTDFFFPDRCLNCNTIIAANVFVCEICISQIKFTTDSFESENIVKEKCKSLFPVENAFALMEFQKEGLSRELMHNLKYKGRENIGNLFAEWTIERLHFKEKPDLIITVPLHKRKQKKRGYNQLQLYADNISKHYAISYDKDIMRRNFHTKAQALKVFSKRVVTKNLFSLNKSISGKHVLLIDDVFTTGNTMSTMAWEILKNKNNKISVLVMANDEG
ncbi:comF family protein [Halpernia frigidisoli]|uniref:ComF family protein n=1 Tax=Halpernia frigidisoli TaxID=1125876 RepID=A0A1I3FRW1_9FLAO|nr:comF family protein [Halpernia frigidisoli]